MKFLVKRRNKKGEYIVSKYDVKNDDNKQIKDASAFLLQSFCELSSELGWIEIHFAS